MKKISILSLSVVVVTFLACISCGYLISNALISFGTLSQSSSVFFESQKLYAVSMANGKAENELENQKRELQKQNGAGYIYKHGDDLYLLASLYDNKNDAELVKTNLKQNGVESEILTIDFPEQKLEGNFNQDEKTILLNCLKAEFDTFKKLYDVAISLDTGVFDKTKAKLECNSIYSNIISIKTNFNTFFKDKTSNLKTIENRLKKSEDLLSNLISENLELDTQTFSSLIKLTYCKLLLNE